MHRKCKHVKTIRIVSGFYQLIGLLSRGLSSLSSASLSLELSQASSNPYYCDLCELYLMRALREASCVLYVVFSLPAGLNASRVDLLIALHPRARSRATATAAGGVLLLSESEERSIYHWKYDWKAWLIKIYLF